MDVLHANHISKSYGKKKILGDIHLHLADGELVCILGVSGVGKTTLLRMLMGELKPTEGRFKLGTNVAFGYYDQGQQLLHDDLNVLEELRDTYHQYNDTELR